MKQVFNHDQAVVLTHQLSQRCFSRVIIFARSQPRSITRELLTETETDGTPIPAISNIVFRIDDSLNRFKTGQCVRIVFPTVTDFGGYDITIVTDSQNSRGFGVYGVNVTTIVNSELSAIPIIEVTCVDATTYTFVYDILR